MSIISKARRSSVKDEEPSPNGIVVVMKSVIDIYNDNTKSWSNGKATVVSIESKNVVIIKHLPFSGLYAMIEQHKLHMHFLKENEVLSENKKISIINRIEHIFSIIECRSVLKKMNLYQIIMIPLVSK